MAAPERPERVRDRQRPPEGKPGHGDVRLRRGRHELEENFVEHGGRALEVRAHRARRVVPVGECDGSFEFAAVIAQLEGS